MPLHDNPLVERDNQATLNRSEGSNAREWAFVIFRVVLGAAIGGAAGWSISEDGNMSGIMGCAAIGALLGLLSTAK